MTPDTKTNQHPNRRIEKLPSGLTVTLLEIHEYPVVLIDMWIRAGSRDETPPEYGMSHFLEHMIFDGNKKYSKDEHKRTMFRLGGEENAGTMEDLTTYYIVVPSEHFSKGLELHHAMVTSPLLEESEFTRERDVVMEEIKMYEDDPGDTVREKSMCALFSSLGYNHPVLGTVDSLSNMNPGMMRDYFTKHYSPENMMLVIIGDFDSKKILPEISSLYADFQRENQERPIEFKSESIKEKKIIRLKRDIDATYLTINFAAPPFRNYETYALDVLMEALGGARSARLKARLFEELNLVTNIAAWNNSYMDASKLAVDAELKDSRNLPEVLDEIFRILNDVAESGLSDDELESAKTRLIADKVFGNETHLGINFNFGTNMMIGSLEIADNLIHRTASVTGDQVLDVARRYLRPENMSLGINQPEIDPEIDLPLENFKPRYYSPIELDIPHGEITSHIEPEAKNSGLTSDVVRETLPNGVVWLYKCNPVNPAVAFQVYVRHGLALENWETNGISEVMQRALRKGTISKSAKDLNLAIDALGIRINADTQRDYLTVNGLSLSRDFRKGFGLLAEIVNEPSFPDSEVEKVVNEVLGVLTTEEDDTDLVSSKCLRLELFGQDHPYGRPTSGRTDSVALITAENLGQFHRNVYSPENLVVSISGDISEDEAREMVVNHFGSLTGNGSMIPDQPIPDAPTEEKMVIIKRDKSQVKIFLGRLGPSLFDPEYPAIKVMNTILGGTSYSRLFNVLRDAHGLAYSTYSWLIAGMHPGLFASFIGTSPENFTKSIEGIKNEYRRLLNERPSTDELESAINSLRGAQLIRDIGNRSIASRHARNEAMGLPYDFDIRLLDEYRKVTVEDIVRVAGKYCNPEGLIITACGQVLTPGTPLHKWRGGECFQSRTFPDFLVQYE
ncbi:MAG: pitrilysin family protein [bacterium]|nr:pitrilysin family protein [bacterium]